MKKIMKKYGKIIIPLLATVESIGATCITDQSPGLCTAEELQEVSKLCNSLLKVGFAQCNNADGLTDLVIKACKFDLCTADKKDRKKEFCNVISAREEMCKDAGVEVDPFLLKVNADCPIECPTNMIFKKKAPGCLPTTQSCQKDEQPACDEPAESRCVCDDDHPYWNPLTQECVNYCPNYKFKTELSDEVPCTTYFFSEDFVGYHAEAESYCAQLTYEGQSLALSSMRSQAEAELHLEYRQKFEKARGLNTAFFWLDGKRDMTVENPMEHESAVFRYTDGTEVCGFWQNPKTPDNQRGWNENCLKTIGRSPFHKQYNTMDDINCDIFGGTSKRYDSLRIACELRTCIPECDA